MLRHRCCVIGLSTLIGSTIERKCSLTAKMFSAQTNRKGRPKPMSHLLSRYAQDIKRTAKRSQRLKGAYYQFVQLRHRTHITFAELKGKAIHSGEVTPNPDNIVWIFCTARSGSTWLRAMLADSLPSEVWEEPKVGQLFGAFYDQAKQGQLGSSNFVLGNPTKQAWTKALRNFVLETARASHPSIKPEQYLIVKEPDGAIGAPLLMSALPESRMILLVRDPRDVVASSVDAHKKGNWMYEHLDESQRARRNSSKWEINPFVRGISNKYLQHLGNAKQAYDDHRSYKMIVRYEDLRASPLGTMRKLCSELQLPIDQSLLSDVVEAHAWEKIPKQEKGSGKFYRKAKPGGWKEELSPKQTEIVENITNPLLEAFYS